MSFLERIKECAEYREGHYLPLLVEGAQVGQVTRDFASWLAQFPKVFNRRDDVVILNPDLKDFAERTAAVADVTAQLKSDGLLPGWRGEPYSVNIGFSHPALLEIERAAVPLFGTRGYGVNLNGYVQDDEGLRMWVGKRSWQKQTSPGKLDHLVAGGQPSGISLRDNLIKECWEEAGIPSELARQARSAGYVSFITEREEGLRHDVSFCYDLPLPADFTPQNIDGEVESFALWPIEQVIETVRDTDQFKFSVSLVLIDFLVRHGHIDADEPGYSDIISGLRL